MGKKRIRFGSRGKKIEDFVDPNKDPHSYLERYILEEKYKDWFDRNYPDTTIYEAVGLNEWDYNAMVKKLSANQDTVEDISEPESEPKSEPEPEPELELEPKDDGKISGKWTAEPPGAERTRPTKQDDEISPAESAVFEEQKRITKKRTDKLFWMRVGISLIAGSGATFLFEGIEDSEERRWSSIAFMIVLFIITCFIAKGMKINFPRSDRKKLVTTGIGSFIFLYLFAWIMTYTLLNLPKDNFSLPFT